MHRTTPICIKGQSSPICIILLFQRRKFTSAFSSFSRWSFYFPIQYEIDNDNFETYILFPVLTDQKYHNISLDGTIRESFNETFHANKPLFKKYWKWIVEYLKHPTQYFCEDHCVKIQGVVAITRTLFVRRIVCCTLIKSHVNENWKKSQNFKTKGKK